MDEESSSPQSSSRSATAHVAGPAAGKRKRMRNNGPNDADGGGGGGSWECSVCTYHNAPAAFKCEMCDVRKGTSTRKPRLNAAVVEQQEMVEKFVHAQQATFVSQTGSGRPGVSRNSLSPMPLSPALAGSFASPSASPGPLSDDSTSTYNSPMRGGGSKTGSTRAHRKRRRTSLLNRVDRNSARTVTVTVDDVTVVITDYQPKCEGSELAAPISTGSTKDDDSQNLQS